MLGFITFSQEKSKYQVVVIQTSAECGQCKERIENQLNYTKGIKYAELNLEDLKLTVKYNSSKITLEEIKTQIIKLGYDADDVKAEKEAYQKLPKCCQINGMSQ
jgi:copper chaperone CopZ